MLHVHAWEAWWLVCWTSDRVVLVRAVAGALGCVIRGGGVEILSCPTQSDKILSDVSPLGVQPHLCDLRGFLVNSNFN